MNFILNLWLYIYINIYESLNYLIAILEKLKENPFVSNITLNSISIETKNIIDNLYNYVNFYYIYASLLLVKSEYTLQPNHGINQIEKIKNTLNSKV